MSEKKTIITFIIICIVLSIFLSMSDTNDSLQEKMSELDASYNYEIDELEYEIKELEDELYQAESEYYEEYDKLFEYSVELYGDYERISHTDDIACCIVNGNPYYHKFFYCFDYSTPISSVYLISHVPSGYSPCPECY